MPEVPVYNPNRVQTRAVATTPRRGLSDAAFETTGPALQGLGRALGQAGQAVEQIVDMRAETKAREADMAASQFILEQQTELGKLKGLEYDEAAPVALRKIEEFSQKASVNARNDLERRMIGDVVKRRVMSATQSIAAQRVKEVEYAQKASAVAHLSNNQQFALAKFGTDDWEEARAQVIASAADLTKIEGLGGDQAIADARTREALTGVYSVGISAAIDRKDFDTAQRMIDEGMARGDINADAAVKLHGAFREAKTDYEAARISMDVLADGVFTPLSEDLLSSDAPEYQTPVDGAKMTSGFGVRTHPISGQRKMHTGQDLAVPVGTPVKAMAAGKVVFAGKKGGYGNHVIVDHGNGNVTSYSHLNEIDVKVGQTVGQGAVVAKSGATGNVTGPHLHVEVSHGGRKIDPAKADMQVARQSVQPTVENRYKLAKQLSGGDPDLFAKLVSAFNSKLAQDEAVKSKRMEAVTDEIYTRIDQGQEVPASLLNQLEPRNRVAMKDYIKNRAERANDEVLDLEDNAVALGELSTQAVRDPRGFMAPGYLESQRPRLSKSQYSAFLKQREQYRQGGTPTSSMEDTNRAAEMASEGLTGKEKSSYKGVVYRTVRDMEARLQRELTPEEILGAATRLRTEVKGSGGFLGLGAPKGEAWETAPALTAKPAEIDKAYMRIPPTARHALVQAYKKAHNGQLPSRADVIRQYNLKVAAGG